MNFGRFGLVLPAFLAMAPACGPSGGAGETGPAPLADVTLATPPVTLDPGAEKNGVCQSFRLQNDEPLFVNGVTLISTPGIHHSDWFAVPEDALPDSALADACSAVGFATDTPVHGRFLAGQSTQSLDETQSFGAGTAFVVPAHAQIFAQVHLLNVSQTSLDISVEAHLHLLRPSEVDVRLTAGGGLIGALAVPPLSRSRFSSECTFSEPASFKGYFVVPHYHRYGTGMRLELVGGPRDGQVVWSNEGSIGEALGRSLAPPVDFTGATGFRFGCSYENTTAQTIEGGSTADHEMCNFIMQTDWTTEFYGVVAPGLGVNAIVDRGVSDSGEHEFSVEGCTLLLTPNG